jgi:hypothetical protein
MQRTEQSKRRAGHEQDRTSSKWSVSAETLELEDMTQAFGARIPASLDYLTPAYLATDAGTAQHDMHGLHPFS